MILDLPFSWLMAVLLGDHFDYYQSTIRSQGSADVSQHSLVFGHFVVGKQDQHCVNAAGGQHWIVRFSKLSLHVPGSALI
jgi:hypothetical protein